MIPKKILLCTDFSENSVPALENALDYAQRFGAELCLVHVINSSQVGYSSWDDEVPPEIRSALDKIQQSAHQALELLAGECRRRMPKVESCTLIGVPASEIVRYAKQENMNLIVMGTHGWTGFKHLILGSTAENVVRNANCPVLTVRGAHQEHSARS